MATTLAALKGKFGSTEYFVLSMKAKELAEKSLIPSEMEDWLNLSLEEREQRDINYVRVKKQIAPYLVKDKDRFFGAIILAAKGLNPENFEPLHAVTTKGMPRLYLSQARLMGFLTLEGNEVLIPLDGQHRIKAIKFAIEGKDEKGNVLFPPNLTLADEDVTVMLVPYDNNKARKIFTKVNRYAKSTTTGQNLVTDDDDIIAVLSRMVANDVNIIGPDLVNYKTSTLSDRVGYFTTLATIAECNVSILEANFPEKIVRTELIEDQNRKRLYENKIRETWRLLVEHIDLFSEALEDKEKTGDDKRMEIRRDYLLGKPVVQLCLVRAFARLTTTCNMNPQKVVSNLNKIDWRKDNRLWDRLLMSGGRFLSKNKNLATDIISYLAGESLGTEGKNNLKKRYRDLFPESQRGSVNLPTPK